MTDPEPKDPDHGGGEPPGIPAPPGEVAETPTAPSQEEGRRPTPVRMAMEGVENEAAAPTEERRTVVDPSSEAEWVVAVSGRSGSGILPLRTIPLLELTFAKGEEPDRPVLRALTRGEELHPFTDEDLLRLLASAEPYRPPQAPPSTEETPARKERGRRGPRN